MKDRSELEKLSQAELVDLILLLAAKIEVLEERVNQDSQNSSKPPSSDIKKAKIKRVRRISSKNRGAQEGHKGAGRVAFPVEEVLEVIICSLPETCECGGKYEVSSGYKRHQVVDIPAKYRIPASKMSLCEVWYSYFCTTSSKCPKELFWTADSESYECFSDKVPDEPETRAGLC
jgi:hypothetical protein